MAARALVECSKLRNENTVDSFIEEFIGHPGVWRDASRDFKDLKDVLKVSRATATFNRAEKDKGRGACRRPRGRHMGDSRAKPARSACIILVMHVARIRIVSRDRRPTRQSLRGPRARECKRGPVHAAVGT